MSSRVILIPRRLKQCSLENTTKSDRGRCYRDTYIRGGDIIHTRCAFIKKPQARVERCDRGLQSDPLHSNPRGNLLPGFPVSESAISDPFYQLAARIRYEDPSLRDSSTISVLALLRFFLSRRFLPLLCLMILSIAHRENFPSFVLYIFLFFLSCHDTRVLVL